MFHMKEIKNSDFCQFLCLWMLMGYLAEKKVRLKFHTIFFADYVNSTYLVAILHYFKGRMTVHSHPPAFLTCGNPGCLNIPCGFSTRRAGGNDHDIRLIIQSNIMTAHRPVTDLKKWFSQGMWVGLAQLVEYRASFPKGAGSSPTWRCIFFHVIYSFFYKDQRFWPSLFCS